VVQDKTLLDRSQFVIPAAGAGTRLQHERPKALVPIAGRALLAHTLDALAAAGVTTPVVIAIDLDREPEFRDAVGERPFSVQFVRGGDERQHSVRNALDALDPNTELVAIHDAARPFVSADAIHHALDQAHELGAATVAVPVVDTILVAGEDECLRETPDRSQLWACQTPQVFRRDIIVSAHAHAAREAWLGTDDATLVRRLGHPVKLVRGSAENFKVTLPLDLMVAERLMQRRGETGCA